MKDKINGMVKYIFDAISDKSHAYYSTINNLIDYNEKIRVNMLAYYSTSCLGKIVYITAVYKK